MMFGDFIIDYPGCEVTHLVRQGIPNSFWLEGEHWLNYDKQMSVRLTVTVQNFLG